MKVIGEFNNISKEMKPRILKPGEIVTYRYLGGAPNTDPDETARKKRPIIWPEAVVLRLKDRIYDTGKKDYVDIGVPKVGFYDSKEVHRCDRLELRAQENDGYFYVTGGSAEHQELFEFFELTNKNLSNPNRDENAEAWFKRIDFVAESKEQNKKRSKLKDAILFASNMNEKAIREFAAAKGWNELEDIEVLTNMVETYAMEHPEAFTKFVADEKGMKERGIIKSALTRGIINFDINAHRIVWSDSGTVVAALDRDADKDHVELFYEWIVTNKNGQNIYQSLTKKLNALIKEAVRAKEAEE